MGYRDTFNLNLAALAIVAALYGWTTWVESSYVFFQGRVPVMNAWWTLPVSEFVVF